MSDIQLFRYGASGVQELSGKAVTVEKELQTLIEAHMEAFLGVRFLASEYSTGKTHRGRIDSLGLDENNCPVIIEYKRHSNENVINQGLFYLDWLLDHQAEFRWLVMDKLGKSTAEKIDWSGTRSKLTWCLALSVMSRIKATGGQVMWRLLCVLKMS